MSSASSPRSDWLSSSRARKPSKASPATASSAEVHVDAQPSYGVSPEGRAHSRQTLSKHLSQSKLGVDARLSPGDASRPRSGSSASVNSTLSVASSSPNDYRNTLSRSSSQQSTPLGSPAASRRRSSAGPNSLPRSPSWYQSTTRKSSLALPELSTIEGSIADLRVEEPKIAVSPSASTPSSPSALPDSIGMKRDRTQDTGNPKQPKRQATGDNGEISSMQDARNGECDTGDNVKTGGEIVGNTSRNATGQAPDDLSTTSSAGEPTLKSWRSYITLPRSSKPLSKLKQTSSDSHATGPAIATPIIVAAPEDIAVSQEAKSSKAREPGEASEKAEETVKTVKSTLPAGAVDVTGKLDLRSFAAGAEPASAQPCEDPANLKSQGSSHSMQTSVLEPTRSGPKSSPGSKPNLDINVSPVGESSTLRAAPRKAEVRPTSWFYWSSAAAPSEPQVPQSETAPTVEEPGSSDAVEQSNPESQPALANAANGTTSCSEGPKHEVKPEGEPNASPLKEVDSHNYATWSAWLGSYLSKPVETTFVTYAAGGAPSITSSVASSNVPEADETLPPSPPIPEEPVRPVRTPSSPTLQRVNPILDVMPRSTWSSFFTSRHLPLQKTIDNKAANDSGEVETMEIDFGSLAATEVIGTAAYMTASARRSSAAGSAAMATTQSAPASAGQGSSAASTSTIKPLTKDKKGSKGSTVGTASKSKRSASPKPPKPNLILPTFEDTFDRPPRSLPPARSPATSPSGLKKAVTASLSYFFSSSSSRPRGDSTGNSPSLKGKEREIVGDEHERLPKATKIVGPLTDLGQAGRIAVIGVHGWFIQGYLKNVVGEPTGTSLKFANMMKASVKAYYEEMGHPLNDEAITAIPLEGDGTVKDRTERLYENLMARQDWIEALNNADRVFIASHSQGTIVSAMLIERLINEGEINGTKCMLLNMCSVSQGPFYSLYNSWTVPAYLYFETAAATELFEFQKPQSAVSKAYTESLQHILNAGVKILFVASLNDQVVPLYSALFSSLSHPNILRTIFIDSSVFETSADFMTNLVVFSTRLRNAGLNCHGLDFHLSEALMGSLVGVGHSTVYEEPLVYKYAVRYLMETTSPQLHGPGAFVPAGEIFKVEDFNPRAPANPYFLPWALRGIIEDPQIRALFSGELQTLRDQFEEWRPKTKALQQVQAALEPLRLIPRSMKSQDDLVEAISTTPKKATAKL